MSTQPKTFVAVEEYLERELTAEYKNEYWRGEIFAMSGGTEPHSLIAANCTTGLRPQVRGRNCRVYTSDLRVVVSATGLQTYPDLSVVCGERQFWDGRRDAITNPTVLVEVLSPSTEAYDRGRKFEHYRTLSSLQQYVLIWQERIHIEMYSRREGQGWLLTEVNSREESLVLSSIGCTLAVSEIYEDVEIPAKGDPK